MEGANVIHVVHQEERTDHQGDENFPAQEDDPTAAVMSAVRAELQKSRQAIVADVHERTLPAIEAAVKKAMMSVSGKQKQPKRKRQPVFQKKGNEQRYEANEEILDSIEDAIDDIGCQDLDSPDFLTTLQNRPTQGGT